jgi:hypothetical protein
VRQRLSTALALGVGILIVVLSAVFAFVQNH